MPTGASLIDGCYDEGLWELGDEETEQLKQTPPASTWTNQGGWGIEQFALGRDGVEMRCARAYRADLQHRRADLPGYRDRAARPSSPTRRAKLDVRLPPLIDPAKAIEAQAPPGRARLRPSRSDHPRRDARSLPYKISVGRISARQSSAPPKLVFGAPPVVNGVSAEGTISSMWMPTVLTGFAQPDCNLHAPDESIDLEHYIKGHQDARHRHHVGNTGRQIETRNAIRRIGWINSRIKF